MSCVFCDALKDSSESAVVYVDDNFGIVMDRFPITRGHLLIFPRAHVPDVLELQPSDLGAIMHLVAKVSKALKKTYALGRTGLFTAGKEVADHGHLHVLPLSDGLKKTFEGLSQRERMPLDRDVLAIDARSILENMEKS